MLPPLIQGREKACFGVTEPGQIGKLSVKAVEAPGMVQRAVSGLEDAGKFLTKTSSLVLNCRTQLQACSH